MQALYLDGTQSIEVEVDGPALAITRRDESTRLIPFRLLSHIMSHGKNIRWNQEALLACAKNDIPIFLSDGQHHLVGAMRANKVSPAQDWQRFIRFIESSNGLDSYRTFLRGKQTQVQNDISTRWIDRGYIQMPGYHRAARIVGSAIRCDLEAELHRRGFRRRLTLLKYAGIDLASDFHKLMEPAIHWVINETWKRECIQNVSSTAVKPTRRQLLYYYEQQAENVRDTIRALIVSFLYWLAERDVDCQTGANHAD